MKVIIGNIGDGGARGDRIAADPLRPDIPVPPDRRRSFRVDTCRRSLACVFAGGGRFSHAGADVGVLPEREVKGREVDIRDLSGNRTLARSGAGDEVRVTAGPEGVRFLPIVGAPIEAPVARHGPIVMNTETELRRAIAEMPKGTFIGPRH